MTADDLKRLIEAVEAGEIIQASDARAIWPEIGIWLEVCKAAQGSVDAAFALLGALLRGWAGSVNTMGQATAWCSWVEGDAPYCTGEVPYCTGEVPGNPARALLLAILKAKLMEVANG